MVNLCKEIKSTVNREPVCPVCGSVMQSNGVFCSNYPECRYDASVDYEKYPTLQPVSVGVMTVSALQKQYEGMQDAEQIELIEKMKQLPEYRAMEKRVAELEDEKCRRERKLWLIGSALNSELLSRERKQKLIEGAVDDPAIKQKLTEVAVENAAIERKLEANERKKIRLMKGNLQSLMIRIYV